GQHFSRMLAKPWRRLPWTVDLSVKDYTRSNLRHFTAARNKLVKEATPQKLRIPNNFVDPIYRTGWHARLTEDRQPMVPRRGLQNILDKRNDPRAMLAPQGIRAIARIGRYFWLAGNLPEALPYVVVSQTDSDGIVGGLKCLIDRNNTIFA